MTTVAAFVLGFGVGLATMFCIMWGIMMRPRPEVPARVQPLTTEHDWYSSLTSGPRRRCLRCYESEGDQQPRCPGHPTPIVIDTGEG
jgi:hypothetical protein